MKKIIFMLVGLITFTTGAMALFVDDYPKASCYFILTVLMDMTAYRGD